MLNKLNITLLLGNISFISLFFYNNYKLTSELNDIKLQLIKVENKYDDLLLKINSSHLQVVENFDTKLSETGMELSYTNGLLSLFTSLVLLFATAYFFRTNVLFIDKVAESNFSVIKECTQLEIDAIKTYCSMVENSNNLNTNNLNLKLETLINLVSTISSSQSNVVTKTIAENSDTIANVTSTITQL